jgi:hypothetical protein
MVCAYTAPSNRQLSPATGGLVANLPLAPRARHSTVHSAVTGDPSFAPVRFCDMCDSSFGEFKPYILIAGLAEVTLDS